MDNNANRPGGNSNRPASRRILTILPYILIPLVIIMGISYYAKNQKQEKPEYYEIVALFGGIDFLDEAEGEPVALLHEFGTLGGELDRSIGVVAVIVGPAGYYVQ